MNEELEVPFGTGPEGLEAGKEVGEDLAAFLRAKTSGHTIPARISPLEGLLQLLGKEGEALRDQLAKGLDEAWTQGESARVIQAVAEAQENSKGAPLPADMREALADEVRERAAAEPEVAAPPIPGAAGLDGPEESEPVFEEDGLGAESENGIKRTFEAEKREPIEEYTNGEQTVPKAGSEEVAGDFAPRKRARFLPVQTLRRSLAGQEPGADAAAFRAVMRQVALLEAQIEDLKAEVVRSHQTVEDLRPLLEATAIRDHILPEAAAGGMVLGGPFLAEAADPTSEGLHTDQDRPPALLSQERSGIRPSLAVLGVAAALLVGIGIGAAFLRQHPPAQASPGQEALGLAQQRTKSQKVKLRYLREERRQLELRLQVEAEARKLVEIRRQELERATGTQKAELMQAAEIALQEAVALHDGAAESASRARRALAWVERSGA